MMHFVVWLPCLVLVVIYFFLLCPALLLSTCNCFTDLSFAPFPLYTQVHVSLFHYTSLKMDVLRSSSMGWEWLQNGLITPVLHRFPAANSVFVEFLMINDTFSDLSVYFFVHHQSHLSLHPCSSPAFTNVQLLEKFKETIQLLATVIKTIKTSQSKLSVQIRMKAVKMLTELV